MDCCGTNKPEEKEKDVKTGQVTNENNPPKESHGGCCGGSGMWLHMAVMLVVFIAIWYFSKG